MKSDFDYDVQVVRKPYRYHAARGAVLTPVLGPRWVGDGVPAAMDRLRRLWGRRPGGVRGGGGGGGAGGEGHRFPPHRPPRRGGGGGGVGEGKASFPPATPPRLGGGGGGGGRPCPPPPIPPFSSARRYVLKAFFFLENTLFQGATDRFAKRHDGLVLVEVNATG